MDIERGRTGDSGDSDLETRSSLTEATKRVRESVPQSLEEVGRPALDRFDAQKEEKRNDRVNK